MTVHRIAPILRRILIAIDCNDRVYGVAYSLKSVVERLYKILGGGRGPPEKAHLVRLKDPLDHAELAGV